jgi:hypothetical protein
LLLLDSGIFLVLDLSVAELGQMGGQSESSPDLDFRVSPVFSFEFVCILSCLLSETFQVSSGVNFEFANAFPLKKKIGS